MEPKDRTPVVIGMGVVSPAGNFVEELAENVFNSRVGNIRQITRFDVTPFDVKIAAEVERSGAFDSECLEQVLGILEERKTPHDLADSLKKGWKRLDYFTKDAILAGVQATQQVGQQLFYAALSEDELVRILKSEVVPQEEKIKAVLQGSNRVPVIIGSGYGGLSTVLKGEEALKATGPSRVLPSMVQESMINSPTARLASIYQCFGANFGASNACASGTQAIIEAGYRIKRGEAEGALVIGADALIIGVLIAAFTNGGAISSYNDDPKKASRPWDVERKGFVIGEGAASLMMAPLYLAKEKGLNVLALLEGWGESADAPWNVNNLADPSVRGPVLSMAQALEMGGLLGQGRLSHLAYINAHATATTAGDLNEALAISHLLGKYVKDVPVGSTKSITGHMLGGAGVIESIVCILALQRGIVPGNVNLNAVDEKIAATGICLPTKTTPMKKVEGGGLRYALSNSFGFGGANATVLWREALQEPEG